MEDDAYHYIHFNPAEQAPSYFELEARDDGTVGRVVRFDSFSKILSSGKWSLVVHSPYRWLNLFVLQVCDLDS